MKKNNQTLSSRAYSQLVMVGMLWGTTAFFYKSILAVVSVSVFLSLRFLFGAIFIFVTGRKRFVSLSTKIIVLIIGFTLLDTVVYNTLYSIGIQRTTVLHAAVIHLTVPFFVYFFAAVLISEKPHKKVIFGSIIAFLGMVTIIFSASVSATAKGAFIGDGILLIEAIVGALVIVWGRKIFTKHKKINGEQMSFIEFTVAIVPFAIVMLLSGDYIEIVNIQLTTWLMIVGASILCGALPLVLYYRVVRRLPAERLADTNFISPLTAAIIAVTLLGEQLTFMFVIGAVCVVTGLLISHNKLHPVLAAHRVGVSLAAIEKSFRYPRRAYEYIYAEAKSFTQFR